MAASKSKKLTPLEQLQLDVKRYRTNTLQTLRRDARSQQDRIRQEAMTALVRAERESSLPEYSQSALAHAILATVRDVVTPVIASLDIDPRLNLVVVDGWSQHWLRADTNYSSIEIEMFTRGVPLGVPEPGDLARIMTTVKGLVYHEVGHILYSLPFRDVVVQARFQGGDVPIFDDGPLSEEDLMEMYGWAYAMFDDQRMECALVRMSPVFADYLTTMTVGLTIDVAAQSDAVGDIWPMVCGRSFMPTDLRRELRTEGEAFARANGLMTQLAIIEREIAEFKRATREREMFEAIDRALPALFAWYFGRRTYTALQYSSHSLNRKRPISFTGALGIPEDLPQPGASATETPTEEGGGGRGDWETSSTRPRSTSSGAAVGRERNAASYLDPEMVSRLTPIGEVAETMSTYNDTRVRRLFREFQTVPMTDVQRARAHVVRSGMLDLLVPLTSQADPAWRFRQDDGVLDPVVYLTREPGESDYWMALDEHGSPGPNLAVSLVLDVSYSMQQQVAELFIAAVGVRLACDELALPCTVSTFADDSRILFDAQDPTKELIGLCHGGTEPTGALGDLMNQRLGKKQHLVMVFTDGMWASVEHLEPYRLAGTVIIGVTLDGGTAKDLEQRGFDEIVIIDSVAEFSSAVMAALVPYFA